MNFLADINKGITLKVVSSSEINDKSVGEIRLQGKDELDEESQVWEAFFQSGCGSWFAHIKNLTFSSTFCTLLPSDARIIVKHWEDLRALKSKLLLEDASADATADAVEGLLQAAKDALEPLRERLDIAIYPETCLSPVGSAFVKLSTRSPKDSKKALHRAHEAYLERVAFEGGDGSSGAGATGGTLSDNEKWRILCEETTKSGAVMDAHAALELLLDSDRVYEDLEYALRGPPAVATAGAAGGLKVSPSPSSAASEVEKYAVTEEELEMQALQWHMDLVARAWDPRLKPESEFRGICWGGKLTCLSQYFHPLLFEELFSKKKQIENDILQVFERKEVAAAVAAVGGNCIIDFAWLGAGEVVIVELNPFDGIVLGVFPASTGLFLWEDSVDKAIMKGETPFEFRLREQELPAHALKKQCNKDWRDIIYGIG